MSGRQDQGGLVKVLDPGLEGVLAESQVWSLSSFEVSRQLLINDLNQVSSVSLFMTALMALTNEGLFELARRPSLTQAVSLSLTETTKEPGCG